ncbi:unnamed protein product [Colias eurytheme]|nr:unnamed protein product [Colias eurytheme]
MSNKNLEICVRELNNTVILLQNKVNSLELLIFEQNNLLKNLLQTHQDVNTKVLLGSAGQICEPDAGTTKQRPVRQTRLRAVSSVPASKPKVRTARNMSPISAPAPPPLHAIPSDVEPAPTTGTAYDSNLVSQATDAADTNASIGTNNEWVTVRRKRVSNSSKNVARGTAAPGTTSLEAAERKSYLHVYYLKSGTTVEQVINHLLVICPNDSCFVEQLKPRGDYASFKLTVPTKHVDIYLSPSHWAEDVHIKPWRSGFRKEKDTQKP